MQMQKSISNWKWCIQHEGARAKVPMQPILATTPLALLHMDFTSNEMTMELDQPQMRWAFWSSNNDFMKYAMAYMTPDQTTKTITKFLWQGCILIFGAPAKLLSDQDANLESNIKELCDVMGIWKVRTSPYQTQTDKLSKLSNCLCAW